MILKGSQRGGPRALAAHLLNDKDNDHVTLAQIRGFATDDLFGAMAEVQAISKGTRCRQPVFSLSLSPPKDKPLTTDALVEVADRAEATLGLTGQPRAVVVHEKEGRKHAHVVWSRIDGDSMTAVNMPFYKTKLNALSKELFLENGWELPAGFRSKALRNPLNFTLEEWQIAKRLKLDPREIKQAFQSAWAQSDSRTSFGNAMGELGFYLAQGDRRGVVALDLDGNVFSVAKWTGVRTKEVRARLGDGTDLPRVESVRHTNRLRVSKELRGHIEKQKAVHRAELQQDEKTIAKMRKHHRAERVLLAKKQAERWKSESKARASKFKRGLGVVMDLLTGRLFALRRENEKEAFKAHLRDTAQREQLGSTQFEERQALQERIDATKARHIEERRMMARQVADILGISREDERQAQAMPHDHGHEFTL